MASWDGDSTYIKGDDGTEFGTKVGGQSLNGQMYLNVLTSPTLLDSFGRQRVSNPIAITQHSHVFDKDSIIWDESITGGATSTHLPNEASVRMQVGTASGDKVIRQTYRRFQYYKGKSQQIFYTGSFQSYPTGVRSRYGYFDDRNGIFFEVSGATLNLVRRTYTSGTAVDNVIAQNSWNTDTLDGNGPSGVNLDVSKTQLMYIDFSWLGVNAIRWGFVLNGSLVIAHQETYTNVLDVPYIGQAILPMRAEIENLTAQGTSHHMKVICSSVITEGIRTPIGRVRSLSAGTSPVTIGASPHVVAGIRLKSSASHLSVKFTSLNLVRTDNNDTIFWRLLLRPDLTGDSPTWADLDGQCQYLSNNFSSATPHSSDLTVAEGYLEPGSGAKGTQINFVSFALENDIFLGTAIDGTRDEMVLECQRIGGSGSNSVAATIFYQEFF